MTATSSSRRTTSWITIRSASAGTGAPVKDVLLEAWQADANGIYAHPEDPRHGEVAPGFRGWGRIITDFDSGLWSFETIKPGRVPFYDGRLQAPHVTFWIVARGINVGLHTRMYFGDEAAANAEDPLLGRIEHTVRVPTLIAPREGDTYTFDIRLQGENETVFLDI